jgi:hypothetical protein
MSGPASAETGRRRVVKDDENALSSPTPSWSTTPSTETEKLVPSVSGEEGVNVAVAPLTEMVPSSEPTENELEVTEVASTAREKVTFTAVWGSTSVAPSLGTTCVTVRGVEVEVVSPGDEQEGSVGLQADESLLLHEVARAALEANRRVHTRRE